MGPMCGMKSAKVSGRMEEVFGRALSNELAEISSHGYQNHGTVVGNLKRRCSCLSKFATAAACFFCAAKLLFSPESTR